MGEIIPMRAKKINRKTKITISAIAVVLVITLLLVYFNRYNSFVNLLFGRVFHSGIEPVRTIASVNLSDAYQYGIFRDEVAILANDGVSSIGQNGQTELLMPIYLSNPIMKTNNIYILVYGENSQEVYLLNGGGIVQKFNMGADVICASMNEAGRVAIAADDVGSLGSVTVYDSGANEVFKWYSGNYYIMDAALSPDGKRLAVCALSVDSTGTSSSVIQFMLNEDKPYAESSRADAIFTKVKFAGNHAVIAMSDRDVARYDDAGEQKWSYAYAGGSLQTYSFDESDNMTFFVKNPQDYDSAGAVIFLDENGSVSGAYETDMDVRYLSANDQMAVLSRGREVVVVNKNGRETARTTLNRDVKKALMWGKTEIAVATGSDVELYRLK